MRSRVLRVSGSEQRGGSQVQDSSHLSRAALPLRLGGSPLPSNSSGSTIVHVCVELVMKLVRVLIHISLGGCNFYSSVTSVRASASSSSVVTLMLREHCRATSCGKTNSGFIDHVPSTISVIAETAEQPLACLPCRSLRTPHGQNVLEGGLRSIHTILFTITISQC